jgi:hypothetical protein
MAPLVLGVATDCKILAADESDDAVRLGLLLLSMTAVAFPAGRLLNAGEIRPASGWLVLPFVDLEATTTPSVVDLVLMTRHRRLLPDGLVWSRLAHFAERVYTVDQFTGWLDDIARPWFGVLQPWLLRMLRQRPRLAHLGCILMAWAQRRGEDYEELLRGLERQRSAGEVDEAVARQLAVFLVLRANAIGEPGVGDLAHQVLHARRRELNHTERLQLVGIWAEHSPLAAVASIDEILQVIDACMADWSSTTPDPALMAERRGLHWRLMGPIQHALMSAGRADLAFQTMGSWLQVPPSERRADLLMWCLSEIGGSGWATGRCLSIRTGAVDVADLVESTGLLAGKSRTFENSPPGRKPRRPGFPDPDESAAAERALVGALLRDQLETVLDCAAGHKPSAIVPFPYLGVPPQPLMIREMGWSLPWSVSLRVPLQDSDIRLARLVLTGTEMGQLEIEGVRHLLEEAGVEVEVYDDRSLDADAFLDLYSHSAPDLFWVVGHGEFDSSRPSETSLAMPKGPGVTVNDLRERTPARRERRLLVLNVCEAAAALVHGGVPEFGLAATAAAPEQAVIGHAWPVQGWPDAALFGRLLAGRLTKAHFYEAYEATTAVLAAGRSAVDAMLDRTAGELDDRLQGALQASAGDQLAYLTTWGSAAFLE